MTRIIEIRLVDSGKWNKEIEYLREEMEWHKYKEYEDDTAVQNALKALQKQGQLYEYRLKPE